MTERWCGGLLYNKVCVSIIGSSLSVRSISCPCASVGFQKLGMLNDYDSFENVFMRKLTNKRTNSYLYIVG